MAKGKALPPVDEKVADFIVKHRLVTPGDRLLVAVSGGADSTCLIYVLNSLCQELDITLHIAHLDHCLRGEEGEADAAYVSALAGRLGLPVTTGKADVKAYQKEHRLSLEEAAREVRYQFLSEAADRVGAGRVATGHTRDDQIETILMHLVRGTGMRGLVGLRPESCLLLDGQTLTIIRPLLEVSRRETAEYCRSRGIEPRQDSTNLSLSPLRNRIRHQLVPLLESYNSGFGRALLRTASVSASELDYLDEELSRVRDEILSRDGDMVTLDRAGLARLHPALQRHLLRAVIEDMPGGLKDVETRHIEEILSVLDKPSGKLIHLPHGLVFAVERQRFVIGRAADVQAVKPYSGVFALDIPGQTRLPSWKVDANIIAAPDAGDPYCQRESHIAYLDYNKTGKRLAVRGPKLGDVFQPLGMASPKKLNRFMIDAGIPRSERTGIPVVFIPGKSPDNPGQIVWVVRHRIDDRFKVTPETKKVLRLEFSPAGS